MYTEFRQKFLFCLKNIIVIIVAIYKNLAC
jgi:hypothetical protein